MALGRSGQVHCVPLGFSEPFGSEFYQYFVSMDIFNYSVFMPIFSEFEMMSTYRLEIAVHMPAKNLATYLSSYLMCLVCANNIFKGATSWGSTGKHQTFILEKQKFFKFSNLTF